MIPNVKPDTAPYEAITLYAPHRGSFDLSHLEGLLYVAPWADLQWGLWYNSGVAELELIEWAYQLINEGKVFVDIGCNIGVWALNVASKCKVSKVHTFEPHPDLHRCVRMSTVLNQLDHLIEQHNFALGSPQQAAIGTIEFDVSFPAKLSSSFRQDVIKGRPIDGYTWGYKRITVPVRTLDSFNITNIGLIKMDIEGAEIDALRGAMGTLEESGYPKIIFECWDAEWWAPKKVELFEFLKNLGYRIINVANQTDTYLATL